MRDQALDSGQALEEALSLDDLLRLRLARLAREAFGFEETKHAQREGKDASHSTQEAPILGGERVAPGASNDQRPVELMFQCHREDRCRPNAGQLGRPLSIGNRQEQIVGYVPSGEPDRGADPPVEDHRCDLALHGLGCSFGGAAQQDRLLRNRRNSGQELGELLA